MDRMEERREFQRIGADDLPECLKAFIIDFGLGDEIRVETYDASSGGVGISASFPATKFIKGERVVLKSLDKNFQLSGKIVYVIEKSDNLCRLGIKFKKTKSLALFNELLQKR